MDADFGVVDILLSAQGHSLFLTATGAGGLLVVVLTHVTEELHLIPSMYRGNPGSVRHCLDLSGGVVSLTPFPIGHLLEALVKRQA